MQYPHFIIAALFLSACGNAPEPTSTENAAAETSAPATVTLTPAQLQNAQLVLGKAETRNMGGTLKVNGFIEAPPQNLISISCPLGGYLQQTKLLPGMRVRKGEVLATLDDVQYISLQQDYLTTQTRLAFLAADLARQESLQRDQATSDKALQAARAEYRTQQIAEKALAEKLRLIGLNPDQLTPETISKSIALRSPIHGFVSAVKANIGKYVAPTDVLFELINTDDLHLTLKVFEKDIPALRVGQKIIARPNMDIGKSYAAHIILISQNVGEDRTVEVHCHLDNTADNLLPGMFMTADIAADNHRAAAVPNDAIVRYENRHYLFVAQSAAVFELQEIEPGQTEGGFTAVRPKQGDDLLSKDLVLKNAYTLLMQLKNTGE